MMSTNASMSRVLVLAGELQARLRDTAPLTVPLGAIVGFF